MITKLTHALSSVHWGVWLGLLLIAWFLGHHMGYYYGRTYEMYESAKLYSRIPNETTWSQFLKRERPKASAEDSVQKP